MHKSLILAAMACSSFDGEVIVTVICPFSSLLFVILKAPLWYGLLEDTLDVDTTIAYRLPLLQENRISKTIIQFQLQSSKSVEKWKTTS